MSSQVCFRPLAGLLALLLWAELAAAQGDYRPSSRVGGNAGSMLSEIYKSDVGTGYSGASLNNIAVQSARARTPYVGQMNTGPIASGGASRPSGGFLSSGGGSSLASKPFSSFTPEPTTSPYLNLFREDLSGSSDLNYSTLVRPQLQQQAFNQQVQRQSIEINRRLQNLSAQADFNPAGDKNEYPTGHPTARMYYGHYYQQHAARRR